MIDGSVSERIYQLTKKLWYVIGVNMSFYIAISPLLFYIFYRGSSPSIIALLSVVLGPGISTLFSLSDQYSKGKNTRAIRDFLHFYRMNFLQSAFIQLLISLLLIIAYVDALYFSAQNKGGIAVGFIVLMVFIILIDIYSLAILSRVNGTIRDVFTLAIKGIIKRFPRNITLLAIIIIVFFLIKFFNQSLVALILAPGPLCYFIARYEGSYLKSAEKVIINKYENH